MRELDDQIFSFGHFFFKICKSNFFSTRTLKNFFEKFRFFILERREDKKKFLFTKIFFSKREIALNLFKWKKYDFQIFSMKEKKKLVFLQKPFPPNSKKNCLQEYFVLKTPFLRFFFHKIYCLIFFLKLLFFLSSTQTRKISLSKDISAT